MRKVVLTLAASLALAAVADQALAFCGFYVAQADSQLFNNASKVVLARKGNRTTLTMANDYVGDPREFAVVVPVPEVPRQERIKVADQQLIDQIDGYSAARLVEYHDEDPCAPPMRYEEYERDGLYPSMAMEGAAMKSAPSRGVTIVAKYDIEEYDVLILSAEDSAGLETWLRENEYRIPPNASQVLQSYIRQGMYFFVAKVDLTEANKRGTSQFLRPLQVTYDSPKFMLPIRLGMVNARGPQDLIVYALTEKGRVETTNYRTVKIPTDLDVPEFVQADFGPFYKDMFERQVRKNNMEAVFLEYAWPLSVSCDPCTGVYLSGPALQSMGADWASEYHGGVTGGFLTRLHVRYDMAHFPEDLVFQETADSSTFQGRYVIRHPFNGDTTCAEGRAYEKSLAARTELQVANVVTMTGWDAANVRARIPKRANPVAPPPPPKPKDPPPPPNNGNWWDQVK